MNGDLETTLPTDVDDLFQGSIAHKMAARIAISEYEDRGKARYSNQKCPESDNILSQQQALKLALTKSLASTQTSFVTIVDGSESEWIDIEQEEFEVLAPAAAKPKR